MLLFDTCEAASGTLYPISDRLACQQTEEFSGQQLKWSGAGAHGTRTETKRINWFCLAWRRPKEISNYSLYLPKEWLQRRKRSIFLRGIKYED